jgi:hypothetical protein
MSVLELRNGTYVAVLWNGVMPHPSPFAAARARRALPPGVRQVEIFGAIFRHAGDPPRQWHLNYRFRYVRDDKVLDSKDEKSFYASTVTGTESDVVAKALAAMVTVCGGDLDVCEIGSADMDTIVAAIREVPWMNYHPVGSA